MLNIWTSFANMHSWNSLKTYNHYAKYGNIFVRVCSTYYCYVCTNHNIFCPSLPYLPHSLFLTQCVYTCEQLFFYSKIIIRKFNLLTSSLKMRFMKTWNVFRKSISIGSFSEVVIFKFELIFRSPSLLLNKHAVFHSQVV